MFYLKDLCLYTRECFSSNPVFLSVLRHEYWLCLGKTVWRDEETYVHVLSHTTSYRMAARASGVYAKTWLASPLRVCGSDTLTHSQVLYVVAPGPALTLRSPSLTDLIIEVTRRSAWFPVRWWQDTVLLKPRTSSGSRLKGSYCRPCPHLPQQSSSSTSTATSKILSPAVSWITQDDSIFCPCLSWLIWKMEIWNSHLVFPL